MSMVRKMESASECLVREMGWALEVVMADSRSSENLLVFIVAETLDMSSQCN